jgi:hypothetical protein
MKMQFQATVILSVPGKEDNDLSDVEEAMLAIEAEQFLNSNGMFIPVECEVPGATHVGVRVHIQNRVL